MIAAYGYRSQQTSASVIDHDTTASTAWPPPESRSFVSVKAWQYQPPPTRLYWLGNRQYLLNGHYWQRLPLDHPQLRRTWWEWFRETYVLPWAEPCWFIPPEPRRPLSLWSRMIQLLPIPPPVAGWCGCERPRGPFYPGVARSLYPVRG